ncbi:hypothetical protein GCM10007362_41070 [Saccharibacillus endophyticus]|uniref:Xaa-Pro dipeptidyl-peptidase-like domain-containing protein n=2 Tax=Saccharibacillus endophyticus TaxID=2060666 RepID=A0ABQ2A2H1_9BACL|nr:alpha/beta fold hydrolase [Saccharibacillus endophyticus]GGH84903.1 hypothetical protein GCM10007362_41070 [Saccharibacillus endophyticus]
MERRQAIEDQNQIAEQQKPYKQIQPSRRRKRLWITGAVMLAIVATAVALFLVQNTFRFDERQVSIETPEGILTGVLALPENSSGPFGLVVFVHGDGPTNATYDDAYKPIWEAFAEEGYASLSLDKRGIGGSEGKWLNQSMEDRANDTRHAIEWARAQPKIDASRIGLWGASQAGWVIPKIAREEPDLAFHILVAPAVNWIRQGQYNTRKELEQSGASEAEIAKVEQEDAVVLELLKQRATYEEYREKVALSDEEAISQDRWTFIGKNFESDSTDELANFKSPVYLVLGGKDIHVDSDDTEKVYRARVPESLLSVRRLPEANHSMLKPQIADSELLTTATAIFMPGKLFDQGYLSGMRTFLRTIPIQ